MLRPKNLLGYSCTIKNVGKGRRTSFFFLSRYHASIISSSSRLSRGVFLLGRFPGEGNGNPPQQFCLGNLMHRGVWKPIQHGVAKESDTT